MKVETPSPDDPSVPKFRELYRRHYGFVWHAVRRFGVREPETEDAVQDAFVSAYRRLDSFNGRSPRAWLYEIARRTASNYRRGRDRRVRRRDALAVVAKRPSDPNASAETLDDIDRFLAKLPVLDRELFVLSELEGLTGREVCAALELPQSTAYDRIRALRTRFASTMQGQPTAAVTQHRQERPRATMRGWAALMPRLDIPVAPVVAGSGLVASLKVAVLTAAVGIGGVTVAERATRPAATNTSPTTTTGVAPAPENLSVGGSDEPPTPAPSPTPLAAPNEGVKPEQAVARPSRRSNKTAGAGAIGTSLAEDTAILERARKSLRLGHAAQAVDLTQDHATRFPNSPMADVRAALHIEALCASGKRQTSQRKRDAFLETRGESPVADRVRRACREPPRAQAMRPN